MTPTPPPGSDKLLTGRFIATLGTQSTDGSIHLTAIWYLFEDGCFYVATSSRSRKGRNVRARPQASLMVDIRRPGAEKGLVAMGTTEVLTGEVSNKINSRIHARYMSPAAVADPRLGGALAAMDDITIKLVPASWYAWDMAALDDAFFSGAMKKPGNLLPLD